MSLTGVWMNELHSVMLLVEHADQSLTGKYRSAVGRDTGVRDLSGRTSKAEGGNQVVAFAACFELAEPRPGEGHFSACAWSGWLEKNAAGDETIRAHWLLSVEIPDTKDRWSATKIGESIFQKISPVADEQLLTDNSASRNY
jgi:hypothetical protein